MNIKKVILETLIDMVIAIVWSMLVYNLANKGMSAMWFYISSFIYFLIAVILKNKLKGDKNE